ncbi:MAG: ATP-binding cassette domain-containing protein [Caldilineaceae bacterium]
MDQPALRNVSFQVHAGEIVGVAGVQGNGQTELVEVISGLRKVDSGRITIDGKEMTNATHVELPKWAKAATCRRSPRFWYGRQLQHCR